MYHIQKQRRSPYISMDYTAEQDSVSINVYKSEEY